MDKDKLIETKEKITKFIEGSKLHVYDAYKLCESLLEEVKQDLDNYENDLNDKLNITGDSVDEDALSDPEPESEIVDDDPDIEPVDDDDDIDPDFDEEEKIKSTTEPKPKPKKPANALPKLELI